VQTVKKASVGKAEVKAGVETEAGAEAGAECGDRWGVKRRGPEVRQMRGSGGGDRRGDRCGAGGGTEVEVGVHAGRSAFKAED